MTEWNDLQRRLGYVFNRVDLLQLAMTHRSYSAIHNERLEFLGDSILNGVIASWLYQRFENLPEGDLTRFRADLVKQKTLYELAQMLHLVSDLRLGPGERRSNVACHPAILSNTFEAVLGAIYLDGGFGAAQNWIYRLYTPILDDLNPDTFKKDAKTQLQEALQSKKISLPQYTVIAIDGAAHQQRFEIECAVPVLKIKALGKGLSRRAAEQEAAAQVLMALDD